MLKISQIVDCTPRWNTIAANFAVEDTLQCSLKKKIPVSQILLVKTDNSARKDSNWVEIISVYSTFQIAWDTLRAKRMQTEMPNVNCATRDQMDKKQVVSILQAISFHKTRPNASQKLKVVPNNWTTNVNKLKTTE